MNNDTILEIINTGASGQKAPKINALDDLIVPFETTTVSFDATITDDGLPNNTLTYTWEQVSGPAMRPLQPKR